MNYTDAIDFISQTRVELLDGTSTFESLDGAQLEVDLSIDRDTFRAVFQLSDQILVVTPGCVIALDGAAIGSDSTILTADALSAWTAQPPVSLAPITAGLSQLVSSKGPIATVIGRLVDFNGGLSSASLRTLRWTSARYPSVALPTLSLEEIEGEVTFHDIYCSEDRVSFAVDIFWQCAKVSLDLGDTLQASLKSVRVDANLAVCLLPGTEEVRGDVFRASVNVGAKSQAVFPVPPGGKPLTVAFPIGLSVLLSDLQVFVAPGAGGTLVTSVDGGPIRVTVPVLAIDKHVFKFGKDVQLTATGILVRGAQIAVYVRTDAKGKVAFSGTTELDDIAVTGDFATADWSINGFQGGFEVPNCRFSPNALSAEIVGNGTANSFRSLGYEVQNLSFALDTGNVDLVSGVLRSGHAKAVLLPAAGGQIVVILPAKPISSAGLSIGSFNNGAFGGAEFKWEVCPSSATPIAVLLLRNGSVDVGAVTATINGTALTLASSTAAGVFHVAVPFLSATINPIASYTQLDVHVRGDTVVQKCSIDFSGQKLTLSITNVNADAWTVGRDDGRFAIQLAFTDGSLGDPPVVTIPTGTLKLLSDEYHMSRPGQRSADRHFMASLDLEVFRADDVLKQGWDTDWIRADLDAVIAFLGTLSDSAALNKLLAKISGIQVGFGSVNIQTQVRVIGTVSVTYDLTSTASQIIFRGQLTITSITVHFDVSVHVCADPFGLVCKDIPVLSTDVPLPTFSYSEAVMMTVPIHYDPVANTVTTGDPTFTPLSPGVAVFVSFLLTMITQTGLVPHKSVALPAGVNVTSVTLKHVPLNPLKPEPGKVIVDVELGSDQIVWE